MKEIECRLYQPIKCSTETLRKFLGVSVLSILFLLTFVLTSYAEPSGPTVTILSNSTASTAAGALVNTSGGFIYTMQLNATTQNPRWKGFVGNVSGRLALEDAGGSKLFDWNLSASAGEVYATRFSSSISWTQVICANSTHIANEDVALVHTNGADNITATFSAQTHDSFFIGTNEIGGNNCSSIHTYVNNASQTTSFDEVILHDPNGNETIFATILEDSVTGYNGDLYDFQMILPENGTQGFVGNTPYYFYVELE